MSGLFGGGGGTVNTNTIQNADPWSGVQPYLKTAFADAQSNYNRGPYQGAYLTSQSPYSIQAQNALAQRAAGSPLTNAAQSQLTNTINGQYLDPGQNPYFKSAVSDALGQAASTFAGQYGGPAGSQLSNTGYQEGLQRTLGQLATNAYAGEYDRERANQLQATQLAPSFQNLDYQNLAALQEAGSMQEARGQAELGAQQAAYNAPWSNLQNFIQAISGQGGSSTATQGQSPYYTNPIANALGLGIGGYALYKGLGGLGGAAAANVFSPTAAFGSLGASGALGMSGATLGGTDFATMLAEGLIAL